MVRQWAARHWRNARVISFLVPTTTAHAALLSPDQATRHRLLWQLWHMYYPLIGTFVIYRQIEASFKISYRVSQRPKSTRRACPIYGITGLSDRDGLLILSSCDRITLMLYHRWDSYRNLVRLAMNGVSVTIFSHLPFALNPVVRSSLP